MASVSEIAPGLRRWASWHAEWTEDVGGAARTRRMHAAGVGFRSRLRG